MSSAVATIDAEVRDIPERDVGTLRAALARHLDEGGRVLTFFGRRDADGVLLTAALEAPSGALELVRGRVPARSGFEALTRRFPAMGCFEREIHEQTGLLIHDHPWLKPIRFEGDASRSMNDYPFYSVHGKEVHEVAVGPIHAGVIEPGAFRFMCLGEHVHHLEIHLGYQHRGVEAMLLTRDVRALAPLVETVAGDSSIAHAWAHAAALERLADREVEPEVSLARGILLELERIAMHLASLAGLAADIGFLQGATTYGRLRTTAINATMRLSGSRFGRGAVRPGGVRARLPESGAAALRGAIAQLLADLPAIDDCFLQAETVRQRLRGVGTLTEAQARELGLVGLAARASGLAIDTRARAGGSGGPAIPIETCTRSEGDCWARARVRITELQASLGWLLAAVEARPTWDRTTGASGPLAPDRIALAVVEGFRGEVVHVVETGASGDLVHYKVQDPSLRNWMGLAIAVRGEPISNFPICNKSFDLSYCGSDL